MLVAQDNGQGGKVRGAGSNAEFPPTGNSSLEREGKKPHPK